MNLPFAESITLQSLITVPLSSVTSNSCIFPACRGSLTFIYSPLKFTANYFLEYLVNLNEKLHRRFLYFGYLALVHAIEDPQRADPAGALLALVGVINVPIIYFSVRWWNTLHQGASISLTAAPRMAETMLQALAVMSLACWAYAFAVIFTRARGLILERERDKAWVQALSKKGQAI